METKSDFTINFKDVPKQIKENILEALDKSHAQIFSEQFKLPIAPGGSALGLDSVKTAWHVLTSTLVIRDWKKMNGEVFINIADQLETALKLAPNKKLVGFHLNDTIWPVRDLKVIDKISKEEYTYLNEGHLRQIYIQCGGDQSKADSMFKP